MAIRIGGGTIAGVPAVGAVASLSTAEAGHLLAASAGLVRTLAITGGVGLSLAALVASALESEERAREEAANLPLDCLVEVNTEKRHIRGVIISDVVSFECEGEKLEAPFGKVKALYGYRADGGSVTLIDDSRFKEVRFSGVMKLVTGLGLQTVQFGSLVNAYAMTMSDVLALRRRLSVALAHNWNEIIGALGPDTFSRFFDLRALSDTHQGSVQ